MRKWRVVGRIYGMKYSGKGHKERNIHKNKTNKKKRYALPAVVIGTLATKIQN